MGRLPYFCKIRQDNYVCAEENQQKTIVFSHCSNIDFGFIDSKAGRTSTKGNDKFIRGFIRAAKEGAPIRCNILDRGPDKDKLKELERFQNLNHLNSSKFVSGKRDEAQILPYNLQKY